MKSLPVMVGMAREWAVGTQNTEVGWVHAYDVELDGLKVFDFTEVGVLAWIAELMKHRKADDSPVYVRDVADLTSRYPGAHDLDLRLAVEKLCQGLT